MLEKYGITIIICVLMIGLGVIMGNGAVFFFNRIPGQWLCDYDEEPDEELLHPTCQRVKSTPWKYLFTGLFVVIGLWIGPRNPIYAIDVMAVCWLLLEMSIADIKYRIVPDQLIMLLVVCGMGFIPYHGRGVFEGFGGALVGLGIMLFIGILGKIIYHKDTLGGGDIKLFAALGLCLGIRGILITFVLTSIFSAGHFCILLAKKRIKKGDNMPMVPYISASVAFYLVILREMSYNIMVNL